MQNSNPGPDMGEQPYAERPSSHISQRNQLSSNASISSQVLVNAWLSQPARPWDQLVTPSSDFNRLPVGVEPPMHYSFGQNERKKRRPMNEEELQHYREVRKRRACEDCRKSKRKVRFFLVPFSSIRTEEV